MKNATSALSQQRPRPINPDEEVRYIAVFEPDKSADVQKLVHKASGLSTVTATRALADEAPLPETNVVLDKLGVIIFSAPDAGQVQRLQSALGEKAYVYSVRQDKRVYALRAPDPTLEYLRGYRDGVDSVYQRLVGAPGSLPGGIDAGSELPMGYAQPATSYQKAYTWGVQATGAHTSTYSGKGARIAILDTGIDETHPDFIGRITQSRNFVTGASSVQDGDGHGTHVAGTAAGPSVPINGGPRYGMAPNAELFIAKVLDDNGKGWFSTIFQGIEWALEQGCHVANISIGSGRCQAEPFDPGDEVVARRCLDAGLILVAAAGNSSARSRNKFCPVEQPAGYPSIMAVGAVDERIGIADFSARQFAADAQIDIVAPGVNVHSAYPGGQFERLSGTSMAAPHVSGAIALWYERTGGLAGRALWNEVARGSRRLPLPGIDVGCGLVQAP